MHRSRRRRKLLTMIKRKNIMIASRRITNKHDCRRYNRRKIYRRNLRRRRLRIRNDAKSLPRRE